MSDANTSFDQIASTTLKNYRKTLEDNIFKKLPLFYKLYDNNRKKLDGGEKIVIPLLYGENSTAGSYDGYDVLDTTPQTGISAAEYSWRQYAVTITISGKEERQNSGKEKMINLLEAKTMQAEKSLKKVMDVAAFGSAGDSGSDDINGLQQIVDVAPTTDTFGGINRATSTNAFWRNNATTGIGSFAANGLDEMRTMFNTCSDEGTDTPDILITTQAVFEYYEKLLQVQERFTDSKTADAGFQNLKFKNETLMWDSNCTAGYMYFLNSDYLNLSVHSGCDFILEPFIKPVDQDAKSAKYLWMGNLVSSNCARMGVLSGITA